MDGIDLVFHLAADHGGRGYIDGTRLRVRAILCSTAPCSGLPLRPESTEIVYASSGCVYPKRCRAIRRAVYLAEEMVGPPYNADDLYGWAKLMGEMTLRGLRRRSARVRCRCRYFTVYGERGDENHAVMAMIARAFIRQNPFDGWGDGTQIRSWTHV